ncbi:metalloprotease TldD [Buchnera aphidicola (Formosaphis micheliae)]|uniref:metalloprotease TldD n=1 Tax=Buchnera aphidicola TaxID=9 RepID=UPI0031CCA6F4
MIFNLVKEQLLDTNKISINDIFLVLSDLSEKNFDYSDLYFQSIFKESLVLEDNIVKEGIYSFDQGIGVRGINKFTTSFAYTNSITLNALQNSVNSVKKIFNNKSNKTIKELSKVDYKILYESINPLNSFSYQEKIEILNNINILARKIDKRVIKVNATLSGKYEQVLIVATDSTLAADIRPLVHLSITVVVEDKGKRESGQSGGGIRKDYGYFLMNHLSGSTYIEYLVREAVRIALLNLFADCAPSGSFPVVLGAGWPGVLLHEAVGHGLESDFNYRETSVFSKKIGQKVTSRLCTIVDDGTMQHRRGSLNIDDEGVPSKYNVLIKEGILKNYMQDKFHANLMDAKLTGNGRRESYAYLPMPRMTNTYMLSGVSKPMDIISSVKYGIFAVNFKGGQVDITSGKFVFSTSEAYLIERGKITKPITKVMLIGSGLESMNDISMVGDDLYMDEGVGICVKDGQSVPVGVGQPTIKINHLTVGGMV